MTSPYGIRLEGSSSLFICDCSPDQTGKVQGVDHGDDANAQPLVNVSGSRAGFYLYGGALTGNKTNDPGVAGGDCTAITGSDKAKFISDEKAYDVIVNKDGYIVLSGTSHNWSTDRMVNSTHHWHECTAENCTVTENEDKDGYGEHTWNDGEVTKAPTATAEGVKTYTCTTCAATKTETAILAFNVSGTVKDSEGAGVEEATVTLKQGRSEVKIADNPTYTNSEVEYSFTGVKPGVYNIVVTKDDVIITKLVKVETAAPPSRFSPYPTAESTLC